MYTNWQEQGLDSFTAIKWYRVDQVIQYLHDLRRYIIHTPGKMSSAYMPMLQKEDAQVYADDGEQDQDTTEGHGMLQQLQQLQQGSQQAQCLPAKYSQRFPSHQVFICEAIGEWGLKLDRLALMSSIMINTNRLERRYLHVDTVGQLEEQSMTMIHELIRMMADQVDVINRQQFETRYGLNWQEEQQQQEHEQASQQGSTTENTNASHVKREGSSKRDTATDSTRSNTPLFRSMSSSDNRSDDTADVSSNNQYQ